MHLDYLLPPDLECWPRATSQCGAIESLIAEVSKAYAADPLRCFGNEARAAYRLLHHPKAPRAPYQRFLFRPAFEPIVFTVWPEFGRGAMTEQSAHFLAECLVGVRPQSRPRSLRSARSADGRSSQYPEPSVAARWLANIQDSQAAPVSPFVAAAFAYAQVAICHPYGDGNGRIARAFFQGSLARTLAMPCPILPMGPAIYAMSAVLTASISRLGKTADPEQYLSCMADTILLGLDLLQ